MNIYILTLSILIGFIVGCGGGGSNTPIDESTSNPTTELGSAPLKHFDNPILSKVQTFDVNNIISDLKSLSQSNFVAAYKRVHTLQLSGFPDLNTTFDINTTLSKSSKTVNKSQKVIYNDHVSLIVENDCKNAGTVHKNVKITPRGRFEADTYKTGDDAVYRYNECDMGAVEYNGGVTYHVNDFTAFDYTFGAIPLGTFESRFNVLSTETDTQKITLNGTIRYTAEAEYDLQPNGKQGTLKRLEVRYDTVGDFVVTVYDKSTGETTKLIYSGTLEKIVYTRGYGVSIGATAVEGSPSGFTYRKTTDYYLTIANGENTVTSRIYDNKSGVVLSGGGLEIRPTGYDVSNASGMQTSLHSILQMTLANGTSRYIFDNNADFFPDADVREGEPTHTLPPSDVDLMGDIVVIGFDTCPPTTRLRASLEALGLPYTYVNIYATQKERAIFDWFNVSGVPYIGIKGSFFGGGYHTDKRNLEILLNLYGFDMNDTVVKNKPIKSVAMKLEGWLETLQSKDKHTSLAVAIDTPYLYQAAWVWNRSSKEKARESALEDCEKLRSERVGKGKKPVRSPCKIYSVDGVKQ